MSFLQNIYKPFGLTFDTADHDDLFLGGITTYQINDELQLDRPNVDGSPYPLLSNLQSRNEGMSFTSVNIDNVIDIIGMGSSCIKGLAANDGVRFYLAAWDQCNIVPIPGNSHRYYGVGFTDALKLTPYSVGMSILESISCSHRGDASASFRIELSVEADSLGNNFSLIRMNNVAIPVLADNFENRRRFTIGPMQVGGVDIFQKTNFDISTNVNVEAISTDSRIQNDFLHVTEHKPVITIRGINPNLDIPPNGIDCTHANTSLFLRKRSPTSGANFVPDATAEHVKFTAKGRAYLTQLAGGSSNAPSETALVIYPEYDAASAMVPIIGLTNQAINI